MFLPDGMSCMCSIKHPKTVQNPFSKVSLLQSLFQRFLFAQVYPFSKVPFCTGIVQRQTLFQRFLFAKVPVQKQALFKGTFLHSLCCFLLLPFSQGYCLHIFSLSAIASGLLRFSFLKESMTLSKTQLYFFDIVLVTSTISLGFRPATLVPGT